MPEVDSFWYCSLPPPPPQNHTPGSGHSKLSNSRGLTIPSGFVSILKKGLNKSHSQGATQRGILGYVNTVHIHRGPWNFTWGCGYLNYLMLCSALMCQQQQPIYQSLLENPRFPGVRNLQRLIQDAWAAGFDKEGQQQLKELIGTNKWIGTADLYVAFTFSGIPCELVEFTLAHPQDNSQVDALLQWVVKYFSTDPKAGPSNVNDALHGASAVVDTDRMPLILQYNGHSLTIVGYEITRQGTTNLLVFDPSYRPCNKLRTMAIDTMPRQVGNLKRPVSACTTLSPRNEAAKRPRSSGAHDHDNECEDDIVEIIDLCAPVKPDASEIHLRGGAGSGGKLALPDDWFHLVLLKSCRLTLKKLRYIVNLPPWLLLVQNSFVNRRKKHYQILYFPMTAPLTEGEKVRKKVVTSSPVYGPATAGSST
ncbi:hypothetical protein AMATHDRAFT_5203 [Amanita thiersii Skay4041]|uniref:UFSP1/2/DUB catalytic domain-containing protein n=1 Tax=Amanita thiersii Skay4041 TaxID=703135 RepID=A0A2A9NDL3_9AGAR|nr:hypothetical protein AMATHDRAFT_5203 [Amanita thiersii Skay4041]